MYKIPLCSIHTNNLPVLTTYPNMNTSLINPRSIIEHYIIIWLDPDINHANENTKNAFNNILHIVDSIKIFLNIDECIHFLNSIKNKQIFLIIADSFPQENIRLINLINETIQINSVYIFSNDPSQEQNWLNDCRKFKGIFTQIKPISDALACTLCPIKNDSSIKSIVSTIDNHFDDLGQSHIYSKLLTEIIYQINYDDKAKKDSFDFCRECYADNNTQLEKIKEFEDYYQAHSPILWYTKDTLIHSLLRDALITQDFDRITKLGFFIRDLHRAIQEIHFENNRTTKFIVYRGQTMCNMDFEKFMKRKGRLYAFQNFISTSTNEETARNFAEHAQAYPNQTGIVFQMEIDPLICSIPFASLDNISYYANAENEVLFSTHAVFRITEITQIDDRLWKVNLILPDDIDQQFQLLTNHIRNEIYGISAWHSLALFWHKMGQYNKAIDIFTNIIEITDGNDPEKFTTMLTFVYNSIGVMHDRMEDYPSALSWYERTLEILEKRLPSDHSILAIVYNNIGMVYRSMGDYTKALSYCEKTLEIRLKSSSSSPTNETSLPTAYSNIGMVYESKGDYTTALSYYKKAYAIQKSSLSPHHPSLTLSYNNLGGIYSLLGEYPTALSYYEKTLEIQADSLPSNHPSTAITYSNLGYVYQLIGNYPSSLSYYEEAKKIQEKIASSNQLSLATTYNNIGLVYRLMGDYSQALSYYKKALEIERKSLISGHPSLAFTYNNIGAVYQSMEEHFVALGYYKKTLKIWQKTLPPNHPSLATIHNNIGSIYDSMKDYKQALSYYEKTIEIQKESSSINQLDLANTYNNIGEAYRSMTDYPNALLYYQKTLEIEEKCLSTKHPSLAITISNMAVALDANNQHEEAFDHAQRALDIFCDVFGSNHFYTKNTRAFLDQLRQKLPLGT